MEVNFKAGDKVKKKSGDPFSNGQCVVTVDRVDSDERVWFKGTGTNMAAKYLELDKVVKYEDKWHLNDGSVDIPDDAEKLMNPEGTSVVAFRYVKKPEIVTYVLYGRPTTGSIGQAKAGLDTHKFFFEVLDRELINVTWEKL